jgi:hypothetical protein
MIQMKKGLANKLSVFILIFVIFSSLAPVLAQLPDSYALPQPPNIEDPSTQGQIAEFEAANPNFGKEGFFSVDLLRNPWAIVIALVLLLVILYVALRGNKSH